MTSGIFISENIIKIVENKGEEPNWSWHGGQSRKGIKFNCYNPVGLHGVSFDDLVTGYEADVDNIEFTVHQCSNYECDTPAAGHYIVTFMITSSITCTVYAFMLHWYTRRHYNHPDTIRYETTH